MKSNLKKAFEAELKRLGQISSATQNMDFPMVITQLGDMGVIAKTIAHQELRQAYNLLLEEQPDPGQEIFLQNMLIILKGVPTPFNWKKRFPASKTVTIAAGFLTKEGDKYHSTEKLLNV